MTFLAYFNHYNIRQCRAQYLDVFYRMLERRIDSHFIFNEEYVQDYSKKGRWEVKRVEEICGDYQAFLKLIKYDNYSLIRKPEDIIENPNLTPSQILNETVNTSFVEEINVIKDVLKRKNIEAGITWVNNKCFKDTLEQYKIPVIHNELGPFRSPCYIHTCYFDFSGVNGNTEFNKRFGDFLNVAGDVPILSREELIRVISPKYYKQLWNILENQKYQYKIGVALQVEVDTNVLLYNNNVNWIDPLLEAFSEHPGTVLVREHPFAGFSMKHSHRVALNNPNVSNPHDFINACEKIYCLNSSIGLEALLLGRKVKMFGDSPFKEVCSMPQELQLIALNFIVFGYLIHEEFLFSEEYYRFRLQNIGNEKEIYLDNMKRLLKKVGK